MSQLIFVITLMMSSITSKADTVLLIHGYLSDTNTWSASGVIQKLQSSGWQHTGAYLVYADGRLFLKDLKASHGDKNMLVVDLPSEAPILLQSDLLAKVVNAIGDKYPDEKITLVGHSAGGVVARTALVRHVLKNVIRLISIASPHLGSDMAETALDVSTFSGPATMLPGFMGGDIARTNQRSKQFYADLSRPRQGNFLDWLNQQVHPKIIWDSIIHNGQSNEGYDSYVAAYSQDMNQVAALKGLSSIQSIALEHELSPLDAQLLSELLAD